MNHAPRSTGKYARKLDPDTDPAAAPHAPDPEVARVVEDAAGRPAKPRGKPGPAPDPDALHAQLSDGRGSHLHAVIPAELHRRLKVRSVMTGETVSAMVTVACGEYLQKRSE